MILVNVGTRFESFERLVARMDDIAGRIDEEVIIQLGHTKYAPRHAKYFDFSGYAEMKELNKRARLVICHAGVGAVLTALEQGSPVIAVPRQKRFHEVNDDHQVEFARAMSQRGLVTAVHEIDELETALEKVSFVPIPPQRDTRLIGFLNDYISQLAQARHMKDGE